jgi:hypothetical protein
METSRNPRKITMKMQTRSIWRNTFFAAITTLLFAAGNFAAAQSPKFNTGDRVECDKAGIKYWEKGTVMPYLKNDAADGRHYRVRLDTHAHGGMYTDGIECNAVNMRLMAGAAPYKPEATAVPVGRATVDEFNTLSADRPILNCPTEQKPAKNGTAPNPEVIKRVIRCGLGEKGAAKGMDGALTIDVTALQIGTSRPWDRLQDRNGGTPGKTVVYPVKVTYTEKTFYRSGTKVGNNSIRVFNFFVNGFGEWQYGSVDTIKRPDNTNVPRE